MNLFVKFSLIISVFLVGLLIFAGVYITLQQGANIRSRLRETGKSYLNQYIQTLRTNLEKEKSANVVQAFEPLKNPNRAIKRVFLLDVSGRIRAHPNSDEIGNTFSYENESLVLTRRLNIGGAGIYRIVLELNEGFVARAVNETRRQMFNIGLIGLAVSLLGSSLLSSTMTRPIEKLTKSVKAIAKGEYGYQIDINRNDEIGTLADSINEMSLKIEEDRKELIEKERMESEMEIGRSIQKRFLPNNLPSISGYKLSVQYSSARRVGGDMYDVILQNNGRALILVADATGKGVPGALVMANTLASVRAMLRSGDEISTRTELKKFLIKLNELLRNNTEKDRFVSLFLGLLDPKENTLTYGRCGHNPLLIYRGKERTVRSLEPSGVAVGVIPKSNFIDQMEIGTIKLKKNDSFYQYSDGITEVQTAEDELLGVNGLRTVIENFNGDRTNAEGLVEHVHETFNQLGYFEDDVVFLAGTREA